jgi:hypothetical protein
MDEDSISFEYVHEILKNCQVIGQNFLAELFDHTSRNIPHNDVEGFRVSTYSRDWLQGVTFEHSLYTVQKA